MNDKLTYEEALNNLIGADYSYYRGDKDVEKLLEAIEKAKRYDLLAKEEN